MGTRSVLLKSLAMAASASLALTACNKDERTGSTDRRDTGESASPGTGYGGQGTGTGGAGVADRTATQSDPDTAFERFGPPGSDWRFTPGTGLYNFEDKGQGGSSAKDSTRVESDSARDTSAGTGPGNKPGTGGTGTGTGMGNDGGAGDVEDPGEVGVPGGMGPYIPSPGVGTPGPGGS